jgi:hypothetical protein
LPMVERFWECEGEGIDPHVDDGPSAPRSNLSRAKKSACAARGKAAGALSC